MMHSSMFSITQHEDKMLLYEIGDTMKVLSKFQEKEGVPEMIKGFYESYEKLKAKIATFDYSKDDKYYEILCQP